MIIWRKWRTRATNQSSQTGYGTSAQGQYAPASQAVPLGGRTDMQVFATDYTEMLRVRAERGGRAELRKEEALEEALGSIWIF
ncbi:hypothetical protein CIPAW_15G164900 [Carya illinoinensis]|uniref:Uncharacterized protein n=1 Tax=Carya illinoinensis TaxID=32201 RepID=A0A8T1NG84_CARIL|nr:hypothetical protein CIPAW_15G164900 [Carya illinoinensis]KAG6627938.1 hypothetical protein CIPAW_15G164900 [Carya illinoinensis]